LLVIPYLTKTKEELRTCRKLLSDLLRMKGFKVTWVVVLKEQGVLHLGVKPPRQVAGLPIAIVRIGSKVQGTIKAVSVDYNSFVQNGQLLACIDGQEYEMELNRAKAGVIVAAITIFIIIYVKALNRRRQIGILKAIGISRNTTIISFVFQAFFLCSCGILAGLLLLFYGIVPYFAAHPLDVAAGNVTLALQTKQILFSLVYLFIAALIGGLLPSWRVARTSILKAIWGV